MKQCFSRFSLLIPFEGGYMMRNKVTGFPKDMQQDEPRAKAEFASRRADGTINTHPQERMHASSHRKQQ
jgi:small acid-soluble spore protein K (minor)